MRYFSGEFEGMRLLMLDELEKVSGGEGEDTDDVVPPDGEELALLPALGAGALSFLAGFFANLLSESWGRENKIANEFSPGAVTFEGITHNSGNEGIPNNIKYWETTNNNIFFDTNGNGKPDYMIRTDSIGNLWGNNGGGWEQIRGLN